MSVESSSGLSARLAREHSILEGIAANIRSGFILLNSTEHIAYANASAERLLGMDSGELLTLPVFDVRGQLVALAANPESAQVELDRLWLHPEAEGSADLALANAATSWLRVRSFPIHDNPGRLLGRGVLLDDITLERTATQARSETLALAAHELKTPLAIIKGCATTLLGNSTRWDPAMQHEMLSMIDAQADRLHDILNALLDVWRLDAGAQNLRLSEVHIRGLVQGLIERWRANTPLHTFVLSLTDEDPVVSCDALRIEQSFNHLLSNAVTYSPMGGAVKIGLETNELEVRLSITDGGVGIAPEHLEHIFDRFYRIAQGNDRAGGSGLGLAVVRATIEAHGGKIWADSAGIGRGTTFYCTLPFAPTPHIQMQPVPQKYGNLTAQKAGALAPSVSSRTGPLRQHERVGVSIVENDARIARYLRANLEEQQYRVQVVKHGIQFLRQFDLKEPDLVLLATHLEDMSGIEVLQRVREFSRVPVLMLCDDSDEDERARLLDLGADDLVGKPFSMKELQARVRVLLRRQHTASGVATNEAIFTTGALTLDYAQHQVFVEGRQVRLSRTEYKLLSVLAQNVGRVLTHELLLERVWGTEYNREVDFIWVYISRLRRKIEPDSRKPRYILTVPDVGYKLAKLP